MSLCPGIWPEAFCSTDMCVTPLIPCYGNGTTQKSLELCCNMLASMRQARFSGYCERGNTISEVPYIVDSCLIHPAASMSLSVSETVCEDRPRPRSREHLAWFRSKPCTFTNGPRHYRIPVARVYIHIVVVSKPEIH